MDTLALDERVAAVKYALKRRSSLLLDNLGIVVDVNTALDRAARELDTHPLTLDDLQVTAAILNAYQSRIPD